jgi:hypothetical protein
MIESDYFPSHIDDIIIQFNDSALQKPSLSLLNSFIDYLFFDFLDIKSKLYAKPKTFISIYALVKIHNLDALNRIVLQIEKHLPKVDDDLIQLITTIISYLNIFDTINKSSQNKILQFCNICSVELFTKIFLAYIVFKNYTITFI